jgi:outer membrane protein OmpA-like peptidoglycan-associated protein
VNRGWIVAALIGAAIGAAMAEPPAGTPVSFLACPIARDTGPDTDLCFYAEHDGNRYALVNPPDWGVPQLKHRVLVEGRVSGGSLFCGAIAIEGRASVMREIDDSCAEIAPFDNIVKGVAGGVFNSGSPQQRAFAEDLARRASLDPSLSVEPAILDPPPAPAPVAPFDPRALVITYPFDSDRGPGPDMRKLQDLAEFARVAKARNVQVSGYCAVSRLSDGSELAETPAIARSRAVKIAGILNGLGVDSKVTHVRWEARPIAGTGDGDWRNRKVEVTVTP